MTPATDSTDETLMERARGGDEDAFRVLFDRHERLLRARVARVLPGRLARKLSVADVLQEARIVAFQRREDFDRERGTFLGWLIGIARRKAQDAARHHGRTAKRNAFREVSQGGRMDTEQFTRKQVSPSQEAMCGELAERARQAREGLPDDYREVLRLVHEQGLSLREVADRIGRSREAVKKLYGRALCRFKEIFGETDEAV